MKLWVKIYDDGEKMRRNLLWRNGKHLTRDNYEETLAEICTKLDVSTPVSLASHYMQIVKFNHAKYLPRDFMEPVDFVKMIIELRE
ncbi:MAG: hypothetical protein IKC60_03375 [Clostridia bacterium]|nr:hypothetical protein [Clostridia bacterium]